MPSLDEVFHYLRGIWLLVRNDPSGLNYLDITTRGFWRSFWAYFYALPAFVFLWAFSRHVYLAANPDATAGLGFFVREIGTDVFTTGIYLVAVALVSRRIGFSNRYAHWLVVENWLGLAAAYVQAIAFAFMVLTGQSTLALLVYMVVMIVLIVATFRAYRFALNGDASLAAGLITFSILWGLGFGLLVG